MMRTVQENALIVFHLRKKKAKINKGNPMCFHSLMGEKYTAEFRGF